LATLYRLSGSDDRKGRTRKTDSERDDEDDEEDEGEEERRNGWPSFSHRR
jgi:hypothetical protein